MIKDTYQTFSFSPELRIVYAVHHSSRPVNVLYPMYSYVTPKIRIFNTNISTKMFTGSTYPRTMLSDVENHNTLVSRPTYETLRFASQSMKCWMQMELCTFWNILAALTLCWAGTKTSLLTRSKPPERGAFGIKICQRCWQWLVWNQWAEYNRRLAERCPSFKRFVCNLYFLLLLLVSGFAIH